MPAKEVFDIVVPMYEVSWCTRAVLEGLRQNYLPRCIHVITPLKNKLALEEDLVKGGWDCGDVCIHDEEQFFPDLSKDQICDELRLGPGLYNAGWFYQQLLKLGANEGIKSLSEWYLVWDSDMLPVSTWPIFEEEKDKEGDDSHIVHKIALIQHNQYGNMEIVNKWHHWIRTILDVDVVLDDQASFVPHHMWFKQEHTKAMKNRIQEYFACKDHWAQLMMRSVCTFDTFSEYWMYASWVAHHSPTDLAFHSYSLYGVRNERFFDDGKQGLFSTTLRLHLQKQNVDISEPFAPSHAEMMMFIVAAYQTGQLPSTINFEQSTRHLEKLRKNMHLEELRTRWNVRADVGAEGVPHHS